MKISNNDLLRRIRYAFDYKDPKIITIFGAADVVVTRAQIIDWLKTDTDVDYQSLSDKMLATFLNGWISHNRGRQEGVQPVPEKKLNNNIILRKLKIALNLKDEDILEILALADLRVSKHELSAFFRKPDQAQYRICQDQILRNFLHGLQLKHRENQEDSI